MENVAMGLFAVPSAVYSHNVLDRSFRMINRKKNIGRIRAATCTINGCPCPPRARIPTALLRRFQANNYCWHKKREEEAWAMESSCMSSRVINAPAAGFDTPLP